jgi:hypothetical protein
VDAPGVSRSVKAAQAGASQGWASSGSSCPSVYAFTPNRRRGCGAPRRGP